MQGFMQGFMQGYGFVDDIYARRRAEERQQRLDQERQQDRELQRTMQLTELNSRINRDAMAQQQFQETMGLRRLQTQNEREKLNAQREERTRKREVASLNAVLHKMQSGQADKLSDADLALVNKAFPGGVHRWDENALRDATVLQQAVAGKVDARDPQVLGAFNRLYADRIKANVGMPGRYGAPIADIEVVDFYPHKGGTILLQVRVTDANGKTWEAPLTERRSTDANDKVRAIPLRDLIRDLAGRSMMARAALSDEINLVKSEILRRGGKVGDRRKPIALAEGAALVDPATGRTLASNPKHPPMPKWAEEQFSVLKMREQELRRNLSNVFDPQQRAAIEDELQKVVGGIDQLLKEIAQPGAGGGTDRSIPDRMGRLLGGPPPGGDSTQAPGAGLSRAPLRPPEAVNQTPQDLIALAQEQASRSAEREAMQGRLMAQQFGLSPDATPAERAAVYNDGARALGQVRQYFARNTIPPQDLFRQAWAFAQAANDQQALQFLRDLMSRPEVQDYYARQP